MSDLHIAPEPEKSVIPAVLIALVVLAAVAAAVFYFNPHKIADLKVQQAMPFAPHTEYGTLQTGKSHDFKVVGPEATTSKDDLYLIVTVNMTDRLRIPLFLQGVTAHVVFGDGSQADASMIPAADVKRLRTIFPKIEPLIGNPISELAEFDPSQPQTGTFVFGFPGRTAEAWQGKRQASITLDLRNQDPQTATVP